MFKRPLKVKTQTSVKKSERKSLFTTLASTFEALSDVGRMRALFAEGDEIRVLNTSLVPSCATPTGPAVKKDRFDVDSFTIYCDAKSQPLFFAFDVAKSGEKGFDKVILPTVYALWRCPDLLALSFSTPPDVLVKMQNGADLMLAGASVPQSTRQLIEKDERNGQEEAFASVSLVGNSCPVAVGRMLMERSELKTRISGGGEMKGRLLRALHVIGDELWALGDKSEPPPEKSVVNELSESAANETLLVSNMIPSTEGSSSGDMVTSAAEMEREAEKNSQPKAENNESMDDLLIRAFLTMLKSNALPEKYPMLDSTVNSLMLTVSRRLFVSPVDIKQTSFKKLGAFLKDMETKKVVSLVRVKEGVQAVDSVFWKHPLFEGVTELPDEPVETSRSALRIPSSVRQVYIVNGKTLPLFSSVSPEIRKGQEFRSTDELKACISQYVKSRDLISKQDKGIINLDPLLVDLVMNKSMKFQGEWPMKWGELFDKILKEMSTSHEVVFTNGASVELKGKLVPLDVKVEKKAGNKLVTVIRNLEGLGMEPQDIARELQQMVGAGVGIREEGGAQKTAQCVTIQGDQTKLLDKFFFQTVSMPKKFVTGLDKPGKKG